MSEVRRCERCGAEISGQAPQGLCPRCLLEAGLAPSEETSHSRQETSPGEPVANPGPLDLAELASLFPQLEIHKLLGRGGMGAVYLARQKGLDRFVALKLLSPRPGLDAEFAERFGREARALARLSHPGIVAVHDFGQAEGLYYFLMEYVDGTSLREVMRQGKLSPRQALALVPQICDALQYAHDEGIVHRDIKPENILLDKKGRIKIADFGLAKLLVSQAPEESLTGSHHVMGTRNYMAPEQLEHPKQVDHRADIYSLGVVFYEMLTGELPLGRFPPPSKKIQVDVRLDDVVLRALEKEPERRYQHASDIKNDIGNISASDAKTAPVPVERAPLAPLAGFTLVPTRNRLSRRLLILIALLALALGFLEFSKTGQASWFLIALCYIDLFLQSWFGCRLAATGAPTALKRAVALAFFLCILFFIFVLEPSSFIGIGLWVVCFSLIGIWGALWAVSATKTDQRANGFLALQNAVILLSFYPAFKPMDYFSWVYRLSGTNPKPGDVIALRIVFGATLVLIVVWKVLTYRDLSRRLADRRLSDCAT